MKLTGWLRRYIGHPDPATAASNLVALVVASNGPFYPLYVQALIGWDRTGAWWTMLASPLFALVPVVARRSPRAGRAALPLVGIANTVWCSTLLGSASVVGLFLLPCIALAALLFRREERRLALLLMGLAIGAEIWLVESPMTGLMALNTGQAAALARLNTVSVATLTGFIALTLANLLQASHARE
jgi:hypothetical protein